MKVVYERDHEDGLWHAHIPELPGCRTDGRSIAEARRNIREAIATCEDVFDDPAAVAQSAELVDHVKLPAQARRLLQRARKERVAADKQLEKAHEVTSAAAKTLTSEVGLSLRDAGELLGLSHQRVKQMTDTASGKGGFER